MLDPKMTFTQPLIDLIKESEGLRLKAYQDSVGVWTCGYGHTRGVGPSTWCTEQTALEWLETDLGSSVFYANTYVDVSLTQNQFNAIVDFIYNLGPGNFRNSSLLIYLNNKQYAEASNEFPKWNKAGGKVLPGLVSRRLKEQTLFNTPDEVTQ